MNAHNPTSPAGEPLGAEGVDAGQDPLVPQITLITKRDVPSLMSKRIYLDGTGKLESDGSEMSDGRGNRRPLICGNGKRPCADHRKLRL